MIELELAGLEVFGRHGALPEERERGQTFLVDVTLEVGEGALSDRLADAVDYRAVAAAVQEVSDERTFTLLEPLADAIAARLQERFPVASVRVRVRKPGVRRVGLAAEYAAVIVSRRGR